MTQRLEQEPLPVPPASGSAGSAGRGGLFIALAGVAFFLPLVFLGIGRGSSFLHRAWVAFREGGFAMYLILAEMMFLFPLITVLGFLFIRGKRISGAALLAAGLTPLGIAIVGVKRGMAMVLGAVSGATVDASQRGRIIASGVSETTGLWLLGGAAAGCVAWLVFVAATFKLASFGRGSAPDADLARARRTSIGLGIAATILAIVLRRLLHASLCRYDPLVFLAILSAGAAAAACAPTAIAIVRGGNADDASRAFRTVALAAFALTLAVVILDRASNTLQVGQLLDLITSASLTPAQRATIVATGWEELQGASVVALVDALGAFLPFVPLLVATRSAPRKVSTGGVVAALFAGVLASLVVLLTGNRAIAALAPLNEDFEPASVTLPVTSFAQDPPQSPRVVVIKSDGSMDTSRLGTSSMGEQLVATLVIDAKVPLEAWLPTARAKLDCKGNCGVDLVAAPEQRVNYARLGPYAGIAGTDLVAFRTVLWKFGQQAPVPTTDATKTPRQLALQKAARESMRGMFGEDASWMAVLDDGADARLFLVSTDDLRARSASDTIKLPLAAGSDGERRRVLAAFHQAHAGASRFLLAPRPGADTSRVIALLGALHALELPAVPSKGQYSPHGAEVVLTLDRAALEAAAAAPPADPAAR